MNKKLYSVRVGNGRWISWCGFGEREFERWYETCDFDNRLYTYEEALKIVEQLRQYYVYTCWICSEDGEEKHSSLKPQLHTTAPQVFDVPDMGDTIFF